MNFCIVRVFGDRAFWMSVFDCTVGLFLWFSCWIYFVGSRACVLRLLLFLLNLLVVVFWGLWMSDLGLCILCLDSFYRFCFVLDVFWILSVGSRSLDIILDMFFGSYILDFEFWISIFKILLFDWDVFPSYLPIFDFDLRILLSNLVFVDVSFLFWSICLWILTCGSRSLDLRFECFVDLVFCWISFWGWKWVVDVHRWVLFLYLVSSLDLVLVVFLFYSGFWMSMFRSCFLNVVLFLWCLSLYVYYWISFLNLALLGEFWICVLFSN